MLDDMRKEQAINRPRDERESKTKNIQVLESVLCCGKYVDNKRRITMNVNFPNLEANKAARFSMV